MCVLLFGVLCVGLRFLESDIGVYEPCSDGECGAWELVESVLYCRVEG